MYRRTQAVETHGTEPIICKWKCSMLESRNIIPILLGETLRHSWLGDACRDVILPLLCSLVMAELLWELNENDYYIAGYTEDAAILINGKFPWTVSEVSQEAPYIAQQG
jgi:hypothetical protein